MHDKQRFILYQGCFLVISFCMLWIFFPIGGSLDLTLIHPWVNESGKFLLRDNWYLAELNHRYVKDLIILVYASFFIIWLASFKIEKLRPVRWSYGYFFCMVILSTSIIGLLKSQSAHACPWNSTIPTSQGFFWDFSASKGHCFPGGHASTGFALMTGYAVFRQSDKKRAYFFLVSGCILGFAMGWAQMMRGAHFLSHNLWTAWIIWLVNVVFYLFNYKRFTNTPSSPE
ncbi:phosphatase PAP2 family protein [Acinetobacter sp. ANC 5380]|jgi:membrane-associated PAP2 superfamily phosphatase|uniref:Phosphatase PAP2 family protein n=1 Tax=Acinetobacter terrae TaxID=2731247 RepID=A0A7Y2WAN1_9GAMM|nr:phosphatase PAP2 family protein [Acinetobacter terrae]NNH77616.1 phosphatase PAP2 family protein [Acinetobacter terrae]